MKKSIFAILTILSISVLAFFAVSCKKDPPPSNETPPQPQYESMTLAEFKEASKKFASIDKFLTAAGYDFSLSSQEETTDGKKELSLNGKLDLTDLENVSLSAHIVQSGNNNLPADNKDKNNGGNSGSGSQLPEGNRGEIKSISDTSTTVKYNVYIYDSKLLVDRTIGASTQWDSIEDFGNSLLDFNTSDLNSLRGGIVANILERSDTYGFLAPLITMVSENTDYFTDYATISYCEETNNYKVLIDLATTGAIDGETIDPFRIEADLTASTHIGSMEVKIKSKFRTIELTLDESPVTIDLPADPTMYGKGWLLDDFEELYVNRNVKAEDFIGIWKYSDNLKAEITEDKIKITNGESIEEYTHFTRLFHIIRADGCEIKLDTAENSITVKTDGINNLIFHKVTENYPD